MRRAQLTPQEQDRCNRLAAERKLVTARDAAADKLRKLELANSTLHRRLADWRSQAEALLAENATLRAAQAAASQSALGYGAPSAAALWEALQTIRDGFALFDPNDVLTVANVAYLSIFDGLEVARPGTSAADLFQALFSEGIVNPGDKKADWPAYMVARRAIDPIPSEQLHLWNGRIIKLIEKRLPDGGVVSRGVDLTEALRIQSALEASPDGFAIFDAQDRLVTCNAPYRAFYAASRDVLVPGTTFTEVLRHGLRQGQYQDAIGCEEAWLERRLDRHQNPDGRPFEQLLDDGRWLRVVEVETPDGGRAGFRIDITAMKEQQLELQKMHEAAAAAERAKATFLSNMGHEIRTPMNGLVGTADLLLESALDAEQAELATTLRGSAEALLTFMDDVLDFSRAESDGIVLSPTPFSPVELVQETVASFAAQAHLANLQLGSQVSDDLPHSYMGDAGRIRQILANLVSNALKFTEQGSVTVRAATEHNALVLTVEDTGIGVPPSKAAHIFDGFAQADEGLCRAHDGSGLGLAICRKLTQQMDGSLIHRPRLGGGAIFECTLPLGIIEGGGDPQAGWALQGGRLRVVAAEDNATNRMILGKLMEPLDIDLQIACNGQECVELVCADPPDLVLMDISMPDMDGCEATLCIRAWETRQNRRPLPIVAMTAHVLPEEVERFMAAGIDRVITKPLKRDVLAAEVAAAQMV